MSVDVPTRCGEEAKSVDQRGLDSVEVETAMSFIFSKFFDAFLSNRGLRMSFDGFTVFVEPADFQGSDFVRLELPLLLLLLLLLPVVLLLLPLLL